MPRKGPAGRIRACRAIQDLLVTWRNIPAMALITM
jgi:hypothetical protein